MHIFLRRYWQRQTAGAGYTSWRVQQAAIAHLRSMSDRELKDIGLSRSQIECAVMGERARDRVFSRYY